MGFNTVPADQPLTSHRWILIAFKREFAFEDVLRLWEVLWTDYYSNALVIFVALAVLESHRDVVMRYLVEVSLVHMQLVAQLTFRTVSLTRS